MIKYFIDKIEGCCCLFLRNFCGVLNIGEFVNSKGIFLWY